MLLNPFGPHSSEVRASNPVKVDAQGRTVGQSGWPLNPAGFSICGVIHRTRPDAHCVMHVHTTPTMAVCCFEEGLACSNFSAAQLPGSVAHTTSSASPCMPTRACATRSTSTRPPAQGKICSMRAAASSMPKTRLIADDHRR